MNRSVVKVLTGGLAALCALSGLSGCGGGKPAKPEGKLKTEDVNVGKGPVAEKGDWVWMMYRGTLDDGTQFDANMDDAENNVPYPFMLGRGEVVKGWDEGIGGMKVGGTRKLTVPWNLGYGPNGNGDKIPPYATLNFEVKLMYVLKEKDAETFEFDDNRIGTGPEVKEGDTVEVHYKATYLTGMVCDDTRERKKTVTFKASPGQPVIPGVRQGVIGMKAGGQRTLVIPPFLAYGMGGSKYVKGNQPLKFVIDLVSVNGQG